MERVHQTLNDRESGLPVLPGGRALQNPRRRIKLWVAAGLAVLGLLLAVTAGVAARKWPFTREKIVRNLQEVSSSTVQIGGFKQTYFPPGCVAENVTFRRSSDPHATPLLTIRELTIQGSYSGLLAKRIQMIRADGAHLVLQPSGVGKALPVHKGPSHIVIGELLAPGLMVEFSSPDPAKAPSKFAIHRLALHGLGGNGPIAFETALSNPKPPGEVTLKGNLGPLNPNFAQTPVSGQYSLEGADLDVFKGIGGQVSSQGKFEGDLNQIKVEGATDVPDFRAAKSPNRVRLTTQFRAVVNAQNGDVALQDVVAHFRGSTVLAHGTIAGGRHKTAVLDFVVRRGRIEDFLLLFIKSPRPPLTGVTDFTARAVVPPGHERFLEKLVLEGDFGIAGGRFTKPKTQAAVDKLSGQAQGEGAKGEKGDEDPETVVSDLEGHVVLRKGTATLSNVSFKVPGAQARMQGTYNVINTNVDLRGTLNMQSKLAGATSGVKAVLLKIMDPFLKKNRHGGAKMPVSITGTYSHPRFSADPI